MSATISPTPEGGGMISPVLSVEFMVNVDRLDDIAAKAAEIDDGNNGEHLAVYTIDDLRQPEGDVGEATLTRP